MGENKFETTALLLKLLRSTRHCEDLEDLYYMVTEDAEIVIAKFTNGFCERIDVTADSGIALIKDVIRALE